MFWIILIIAIVLILAFMSIYNNLIKLKHRVENAWSQIDVQLQRRFDLIPNLVETVKGYAGHEEETLTKVIEARNQYQSAKTNEDAMKANNELTNMITKLFALSEAYPDLKANQNFLNLQNDLKDTEEKIAYARQFYSDAVLKYNNNIQTFPNNLIAGIFGFKAEKFFEAEEAEKENVKVDFSK